MLKSKGIAKIGYNKDDLAKLHTDVEESMDYDLVAHQGGRKSRYIGGYDSKTEQIGFYEVFHPQMFFKAVQRMKNDYNVDITVVEFIRAK